MILKLPYNNIQFNQNSWLPPPPNKNASLDPFYKFLSSYQTIFTNNFYNPKFIYLFITSPFFPLSGFKRFIFEAYHLSRLQNFPPNGYHLRHPPRHLWSLLCWKWYPLQGGLKDGYLDIFCKSPKPLCGFSQWFFSKSSQVISFKALQGCSKNTEVIL